MNQKSKGKKPKKISGTNKFDINEEQVLRLAQKFWAITEIAAFFNVDEGTIRKRFPNLLIKGKELGKARLRDYQLAAAAKGNATMLIWLGKQYLGQKEPDQFVQQEIQEPPRFADMSDEQLTKFIEEN